MDRRERALELLERAAKVGLDGGVRAQSTARVPGEVVGAACTTCMS
jgi:hypothetical protein